MASASLLRRLMLSALVSASAAGCEVAHKSDIPLLRKDVLTDAQRVYTELKLDHGDLTVVGSVDRADTTYDPGQPITLRVQTNKPAYVAILRVLANGDTAIVFPNRARRDAKVPANMALTVPSPGEAVKITGDSPGIVLFEFIASTTKDAWPFTRPPDNGSDFADLGGTTRNIAKDLTDALKVGNGHDTTAAHQTVRIAGRSLF